MSVSTPVNSQITDSVTQANTHSPDNAPSISLANIYLGTSQALVNAAHNAVSSLQQGSVLMQAATTQAVAQLLSTDDADVATLPGEAGTPDASTAQIAEASLDALAHVKREEALPHKPGLDNVAPWSHAVREIMNTLVHALRELQRVSQENDMAMVKQAATAAVLARMIKAPDQLEQYRKMLELIETL